MSASSDDQLGKLIRAFAKSVSIFWSPTKSWRPGSLMPARAFKPALLTYSQKRAAAANHFPVKPRLTKPHASCSAGPPAASKRKTFSNVESRVCLMQRKSLYRPTSVHLHVYTQTYLPAFVHHTLSPRCASTCRCGLSCLHLCTPTSLTCADSYTQRDEGDGGGVTA